MRSLKSWLLVLATGLLIAVGAGMPWAAARFQDRYGVAGQEALPFDPVSLTLRQESEIGAMLRIMSSVYDLSGWDGETRMQSGDACMAAFEALVQLDQHGLLESGYMRIFDTVEPGALDRMKANQMCDAWPMLYTAQNGSSAVAWTCWWTDPAGPQYQLLVDDATGLAVNGYIPCASADDTETLYQRMQRWSGFFADYYGIEIQSVQDTVYDAAAEFLYRLDLEDGLGPCGLIVHMSQYEMDFGVCGQEDAASPVLPEDSYNLEAENKTSFSLSIR